jgi:GNAT superfamily N-acetyltransferase
MKDLTIRLINDTRTFLKLNNPPSSFFRFMLVVRKASLADFEPMTKLRVEFYDDQIRYDPFLNPSSKAAVFREIKSEIRSYLPERTNKACFVAVNGNQFLGYIAAEIQDQEGIFKERRRGHISNIYVRNQALRQKVGSKLAKAAEDWLRSRGISVIKLVVYVDNSAGFAFWKRMGYFPYQHCMYSRLKRTNSVKRNRGRK